MKFRTHSKTSGKSVYLLLAVLVIAIVSVAVTIAVAGSARRGKIPNVNIPDQTQGPTPDQTDPSGQPDNAETPTPKNPDDSDPSQKDPGGANAPQPRQPYRLPVSGTVSKRHDDSVLVFSETMGDMRVHLGVDVDAPVGTAVVAVADGTVKQVYYDPFMGQCVSLDLGDGVVATYCNLQLTLPDAISEGATVQAGETIGAVGDTALREQVEEAHLHFELSQNGEKLDPLDHLSYAQSLETGGSYTE